MAHELYFIIGKTLGYPSMSDLVDTAFVVRTERDRENVLRSMQDFGMRAATKDEAFAVTKPDADGRRRFPYYGTTGTDWVALEADWSPEKTAADIAAYDAR